MDRKQFLQQSALGLAGMVIAPGLLTGCKRDQRPIDTDKRIVIIGAGVAGLRAAQYFRQREVEVIVLEAREAVGGRLRTDRSGGITFDEGASWIHGNGRKNPLNDVAGEAGMDLFETDDDKVVVYDTDGSIRSGSDMDDAEKEFNKILNNLSGSDSQSFAEAFFANYPQYENDRIWDYQLSAYLEFDIGADIDTLSSVNFYDDEEYNGPESFVTNGYDTLANHLAEGIDVRLNTVVEEINYSGSGVTIVTDAGGFVADYVIVAVPLGVLQRNRIQFEPALPSDKEAALDALAMGTVNKYLLRWDSQFWPADRHYLGYTANTRDAFNYYLNAQPIVNQPVLVTFSFGDYSVRLEQRDDADVIEEIMAPLRTMYGAGIPMPVEFRRTRWNTDPFTYGSYSFVGKGGRSAAYDTLANAIDNRVFFAGEHTSRDYRGTVHGAYLSGEQAARSIADLIN